MIPRVGRPLLRWSAAVTVIVGSLMDAPATAQSTPVHRYAYTVTSTCPYTILTNGFPTHRSSRGGSNASGLLVELIGAGNTVTLRVDGPCDEGSAILRVQAQPKGAPLSDRGDEPSVVQLDLTPKLRKAVKFPVEASARFDSAEAPFRAACVEAPVLADGRAIARFGLKLVELARAKDLKSLEALFAPAHALAATAAGVPIEQLQPLFIGQLKERLPRFRLDVREAQILATPYCGGRVWHVGLADGELLRTHKDADGSTWSLPVYVGSVGGALKVVH